MWVKKSEETAKQSVNKSDFKKSELNTSDDVRSVLVELPTVGSTNEALAAESNISAEWKKKWEKCRSSSQLHSYCN